MNVRTLEALKRNVMCVTALGLACFLTMGCSHSREIEESAQVPQQSRQDPLGLSLGSHLSRDERLLPVSVWLKYVSASALNSTDGSSVYGGYCTEGLGPETLSLVMKGGREAIPELISFVDDDRWSPYCFYYAGTSEGDITSMRVGTLACYMIETILRQNPYFTRTGHLLYSPPEDLAETEREMYPQEQAAAAYKEWYDRCLDGGGDILTCELQLPEVQWDYDEHAWPFLCECSPERMRELFGELVEEH